MTLRVLPKVNALQRPKGFDWDAPSDAFSRWADRPAAADATDGDVVTIYDIIGEDYWSGGGFTAKRMGAALRAIGNKPVTVKINSPGGDMFEGITIYNQLCEHPARVSIEVMGYAASAASVIAMAGDDIAMGRGSMLMIHKAWGLVIGNDDDFRAAAELFGKFNTSMVEVYSARTGIDAGTVLGMLAGPDKGSDGTWLTASEAVEKKFADRLIDDEGDAAAKARIPEQLAARRRAEAALARDGVPRKERSAIINSLSGPRDAAQPAVRDAGKATGEIDGAQVARLLSNLRSHK